MSEIRYGVDTGRGAVANIAGPAEVIANMYPAWDAEEPAVYGVDVGTDSNGLRLQVFNSTLRFEVLPGEEEIAILGNTKTTTCPVAADCGSCALKGHGLSVTEMSLLNCAQANTAKAFEAVSYSPESRFMLLPTSSEAVVVDDNTPITVEENEGVIMQKRLPAGESVVFTKSWADRQGYDQISIGMNGADGSFGVATMKVGAETLVVAFCSMRQNMGDRGPDKQILRKAINAYLDKQKISASERGKIIANLKVSITIGASASLENFAHQIKIPGEGDNVSERDLQEAERLRATYPDLVARAAGKITSAIVLNDQYPGAFAREAIFPQFEAEAGIRETPITPDSCPGDGQTCHIDYRSETQYALVHQLEEMGVPTDNITYNADHALDPASPSNNMASNRRENNNGVETPKTNRTINGMVVSFT